MLMLYALTGNGRRAVRHQYSTTLPGKTRGPTGIWMIGIDHVHNRHVEAIFLLELSHHSMLWIKDESVILATEDVARSVLAELSHRHERLGYLSDLKRGISVVDLAILRMEPHGHRRLALIGNGAATSGRIMSASLAASARPHRETRQTAARCDVVGGAAVQDCE